MIFNNRNLRPLIISDIDWFCDLLNVKLCVFQKAYLFLLYRDRIRRMRNLIENLEAIRGRAPDISNEESNQTLNIPPWDNPESECYGCQTHSMADCEKCTR